jgi:hypothetical protein
VRNLLRDHIQRAGGLAQLEPQHLGSDAKRRDLLVTFHGKQYLLDVAIIPPLAYSHLLRKAPMLAKEQEKVHKCEDMARQLRMDFVTSIMDTFAGVGPAAMNFLRNISVHSCDPVGSLVSS